jgi:hypothetical protein
MRKPLLALAAFALAATAWPAQLHTRRPLDLPRASTPGRPVLGVPLGGYSICFPVVTRVQGATTRFFTAVDITNNSSQSTPVTYSYLSSDGSISRSGTLTTLLSYDNYHSDDILASIDPNIPDSYGTLLVTFTNGNFTFGNEATGVARIYNYQTPGALPSIGLAYRAEVLRQNGAHTLVSIIRDTNVPSASGPVLLTNMGLENVGIDDNGNAVPNTPSTLTLTFYDPATGNQVGPQPTVSLFPGQVLQINDVFSTYNIPSNITSLIVFIDGPAGAGAPQIDGYAVLKDVFTNDGSFYFLQEANGL